MNTPRTASLPHTQNAVVITGPQQASLQACPSDATPLASDEVAGQTLASLVSPGTELNWAYAGSNDVGNVPTYPVRPGYAAVMRIDAIGAGVTDRKEGDVVLTMGPHASRQRTRAIDAHLVPADLDSTVAVFARLIAVSWTTLVTTVARPGDRVLISGLGPVGNLAAQIFTSAGYQVTACDPVDQRQAIARANGLTDVRPSIPRTGETFALAVDCSGHEQAVLDAARVVRKRGEIVLVGVPWKRHTSLYAYDLLNLIFHRYLVVRSGWEWELPNHPRDFSAGSIGENLQHALDWLAAGRVKTTGLADLVTPGDAQKAYQDLLHRRGKALSVVFDWT